MAAQLRELVASGAVVALSDALDLSLTHDSFVASGLLGERSIILEPGFSVGPDHEPAVLVHVRARRPRDLQRTLYAARPVSLRRTVLDPHGPLWIEGRGSMRRLQAFLTPPLMEQLHGLASSRARLGDHGVDGELLADQPIELLVEQVRELVALEAAASEAAAGDRIPVEDRLADALPVLRATCAALDLRLTSCPLGFQGRVDRLGVDGTRFVESREHCIILFDVSFLHPLPGRWLLWSVGRHPWRRALVATSRTLGLRSHQSPRTGDYAFDRRFSVVHGNIASAARTLAALSPAIIEHVDRRWLGISNTGLQLSLRVTPQLSSAGAIAAIRRGVDLAARFSVVLEDVPAEGPFR